MLAGVSCSPAPPFWAVQSKRCLAAPGGSGTLWKSSMNFRWLSSQISRLRYSFQSACTASM